MRLLAAVSAAGVLPNHCVTTIQDAVLQGVSNVVTDTTEGALWSILPFDFSNNGGSDGGGDNGGSDPFSNPPVQS